MTVDKYLKFYDETWTTLMNFQNQFPLQEYAERSVLTTWKMSYEQVRSVCPQATMLLDQWAFLSAGDIWYELASSSSRASQPHDSLESGVSLQTDELSFQHSLSVLSHYSLVIANVDEGFSIHPVVHEWCLHNIVLLKAKEHLCAQAIFMVAERVTFSKGKDELMVARRLVPHARTVARRHLRLEAKEDLAVHLHSIAYLLSDWESSKEVEEIYVRALRGYEKAWGADHTSTLDIVNNLGNLYADQGKLGQAEEMCIRALRGYEKAWGADHMSTLETVNNLGILYKHQGKLGQAEEMYKRALRGCEKAWGADHTSTLETVNNLGILYKNQGKIEQAEEMYMRALRGFEKTWGADYTSTLSTVNNLGILYADQGKIEQAEEMYMRALRGFEKAWGADHTSTLSTVNNLGILYKNLGKIEQAEEMYMRALRGKEKAWGADHTSTLETVHNLGILYADQGKMEQAEEMYLRAVTGYKVNSVANGTRIINLENWWLSVKQDQGMTPYVLRSFLRTCLNLLQGHIRHHKLLRLKHLHSGSSTAVLKMATTNTNKTQSAAPKTHSEAQAQSIARFFASGVFSDLTITCQGQEWRVHKTQVCAHSEFFYKACTANFKEADEGVIKLDEDDPRVVQAMLHYMYHGNYGDTGNALTDLTPIVLDVGMFTIADKYFIGPLKALAKARFVETCASEWKTEAFAQAVREIYTTSLEDTAMKDVVIDTIKVNGGEFLKDKDDFKGINQVMRDIPIFGVDVLAVLWAVKLDRSGEGGSGENPREYKWLFRCPGCGILFGRLIPLGEDSSFAFPRSHHRNSFSWWVDYSV